MKNLMLILACLLCLNNLQAQKKGNSNSTDRFAGLDTSFQHILKEWQGVGFAVAVVEKDKIVYAKGFGYRDLEKQLPVTPNTLFAIGSCTKAFTSSILGILQKESLVSLNKTVKTYLPDLQFYNQDMNNQIKIRDLMSHRTGLPRHDFSWYLFPTKSRDSLVKRIQFQEPSAGVREVWQYNNFMFLLQGVIAEKASGKTWEENIVEKIFTPIGMNFSTFSVSDLLNHKDASLGYEVKKETKIVKTPYYNIDAMGPAGSINSSVNEMANWLITWINGGKFKGKEILPASYVSDAISSQMVVGSGLPSKEKPDIHLSNYGLGWSLGSYKGHYRVEHGGNIDGFSASACFFPSDSIGIVVLSNQNGSAIPSIVRNIMADRMLKMAPYNWSKDLKESREKAKKATQEAEKISSENRKFNTSTSHHISDFEGIYSHPGYGNFTISLERDSLFAYAGKETMWLKHLHYDVFIPISKDPLTGIDTSEKSALRFQFNMNPAGDLASMSTALEPTLAPLTFTKSAKPKFVKSSDLNKYVGEYELPGGNAKVYVKDQQTLYVLVPGQPDYELVPTNLHKFAIKIANGFFVAFDVNENEQSTGLTFMQPNGNFKAKKVK